MSKEKPYTPYFDEKSRWWKVKGPSQVDAGWTREDHAQRHADDLNAAFSAGAVTREEVSEPVAWMRLRPGLDPSAYSHRERQALIERRRFPAKAFLPLYAHPPLAAKVEPRDPKEGEVIQYRNEVSGLWYTNRMAAGDIDVIRIGECDYPLASFATPPPHGPSTDQIIGAVKAHREQNTNGWSAEAIEADLRTRLESLQPTPPPTPS